MRRLLLILLLLFGCSAAEPQGVTFLDGTPADLEAVVAGRPAILNFWAASCVFCKDELPHFDQIHLKRQDVAVVGINLQEPQKSVAAYWADGGYNMPTLLDPGSILKVHFDVFTQPTTIVLDERGVEVYRKNGPLSGEEIDTLAKVYIDGKGEGHEEERGEKREEKDESEEPTTNNLQPTTSPVPSLLRSWYRGQVEHLIPLHQIFSGGPPKDGIPSIDTPKFVLSRQVNFLSEEDIGILVQQGNHTKFYPYKILNWHEIVNDEIDGEKIAVTYCPLCATGVVYSSLISEGNTEFGVSGLLYQSNLLMYDRVTESLWNQVTGEAVVGPLTGQKLHRIKSDIVRYSAAKNASPDLLVLSTETGFNRNYGRTPYAGYEEEQRTMFPTNATGDTRLHSKTLIYGIEIDGHALAVTEDYIRENVVFQGYIGEGVAKIPIDIRFNPKTEQISFTRYYKEEPGRKDVLAPVPVFWFSWLSMYPETGLLQ